MINKPLIAAAVSAALFATPALAQQQGQQGQQGQQQPQNQQITQEKAQDGTEIYLSTASVRQIEQALNQQGYNAGNVDGQWDQDTTKAAQDYQKSKEMEPTGTPTIELVNSLGLSQIIKGQSQQQGQQQSQQWAQEEAQGEGTPLYVSTAYVRQIQQKLNEKGYNVGATDGLWGESTKQAAANFQQAAGLEPSGQLTTNLLEQLGLAQQIMQAGQQGKQDQKWEQETAQSEGTPLYASPATVRQIEVSLNKEGYDAGNVDGSWDEDTTAAIERYQRSRGLEPTGTLTTESMAALDMSVLGGGQGGQGQQQGQQSQQSQQGQQQGQQNQQQQQPQQQQQRQQQQRQQQ